MEWTKADEEKEEACENWFDKEKVSDYHLYQGNTGAADIAAHHGFKAGWEAVIEILNQISKENNGERDGWTAMMGFIDAHLKILEI